MKTECDIQIMLDKNHATYQNGSRLRGRVVVQPQDDVDCERLRIDRFWYTKGGGNRDVGNRERLELFKGSWKRGQRYEYPFEYVVPALPLTYEGKLFSIEHMLEARADVPWALDPKKKLSFRVEGGGSGGKLDCRTEGSSTHYFSLESMFSRLLHLLPFWSIGPVQVQVPDKEFVAGSRIPIQLQFKPSSLRNIKFIRATLQGRERRTSGSGKNRKVRYHEIFSYAIPLSKAFDAPAGKEFRMREDIEVPVIEAMTFIGKNNCILWNVLIEIGTPCIMNWKHSVPIVLRPAMAKEIARAVDAEADTQPIEQSTQEREDVMANAEVNPVLEQHSEWEQDAEAGPLLPENVKEEDVEIEDVELVVPPVRIDAPDFSIDVPQMDSTDMRESDPEPVQELPQEPEHAEAKPKESALQPKHEKLHGEDDIARFIQEVRSTRQFNAEHDQLLQAVAQTPFGLQVEVEKTEWTIGFGSSDGYGSGRSVVGKLVKTGEAVALRFHESRSEEVNAMAAGSTLSVTARLAEWNNLYDRPELEVI